MTFHPTRISLLARLRDASDQAAWQAFDEQYRTLLLRFCRRQGLSHADADDVIQQVFLNLSRTLPQFVYDRGRGRFRDYLYRCVRNAIFEWARRPERAVGSLGTDVGTLLAAGDAEGPAGRQIAAAWEEEWTAHHFRMALEAVRRTFDPQNVSLFERMLAGARPSELARELNLSEEAIFKVRQRIRARMQELIAQQIREEDEA